MINARISKPQRLPATPLAFVWHFLRQGHMAGIAVTVAISVIVAVVEAGGTFAFGELINALAADPPDSTAPASTLLPIADPVFIFAVVVGFWMVPPIALLQSRSWSVVQFLC